MAELVEIIGITHNPFLPRLLAGGAAFPDGDAVRADYALMRERLAAASPDVIVTIASDHLNQWFTDNMPAFLVGKAPRAEGPFPQEIKRFGLEPYYAKVDTALAKWFVAEGFNEGVDFAFSDEFLLDHAFTVPLHFLRPEMDLPIVPVWTNVMAPPLPPARRFFEVGRALARLIERAPTSQRVAVVSSGHFAVEVGGPRSNRGGSPDEAFDRRMMDLISAGDAESLISETSFERLIEAGNVTPGFLNYVMLVGLANASAPRATMLRIPERSGAVYYMEWTLGTAVA